jgi:hypothetical protein
MMKVKLALGSLAAITLASVTLLEFSGTINLFPNFSTSPPQLSTVPPAPTEPPSRHSAPGPTQVDGLTGQSFDPKAVHVEGATALTVEGLTGVRTDD